MSGKKAFVALAVTTALGILGAASAAAGDRDRGNRERVFPISGWWKEKPALQRWERAARYALLVSIRAPGADVDIYNSIATQLEVHIPAG
jgi:hypothetical protein